jgi:hypothetical protein
VMTPPAGRTPGSATAYRHMALDLHAGALAKAGLTSLDVPGIAGGVVYGRNRHALQGPYGQD